MVIAEEDRGDNIETKTSQSTGTPYVWAYPAVPHPTTVQKTLQEWKRTDAADHFHPLPDFMENCDCPFDAMDRWRIVPAPSDYLLNTPAASRFNTSDWVVGWMGSWFEGYPLEHDLTPWRYWEKCMRDRCPWWVVSTESLRRVEIYLKHPLLKDMTLGDGNFQENSCARRFILGNRLEEARIEWIRSLPIYLSLPGGMRPTGYHEKIGGCVRCHSEIVRGERECSKCREIQFHTTHLEQKEEPIEKARLSDEQQHYNSRGDAIAYD